MVRLNEWTQIGIGLSLFGVIFLVLGVVLIFDKGLIAMGDILFLSGVSLVIGIRKTLSFFFKKHKWKGTICFFCGFFLVIWGWPIIGMSIQTYGFLNLFGSFIPSMLFFLSHIPIVGVVLRMPIIKDFLKRGRLPD